MNSNYFNRNLINSIGESFKKVLVTEGPTAQRNLEQSRARAAQEKADRIARGQQRNQERKESKTAADELRAEFDAALAAEMQKIGQSDGAADQFEARKRVSEIWAADAEKQKRARALGFGKIGQSTSSEGAFNWRWANQAARDAYDKEAKEKEIQLYGGDPNADSLEDAKKRFREAQAAREAQQASSSGGGSAPSQPARSESSATRRGRIAQRVGDIAFRPPRNADEAARLARAEADVDAAHAEAAKNGGSLGYEDQGSLYAGFDRRGFQAGGGDPTPPPSTPTRTPQSQSPNAPTSGRRPNYPGSDWRQLLSRGNQRGTGNNQFGPNPYSPDRFA